MLKKLMIIGLVILGLLVLINGVFGLFNAFVETMFGVAIIVIAVISLSKIRDRLR